MTYAAGPCADYIDLAYFRACGGDCADDTKVTDARAAIGISVATRVMWLATGRQFSGTCTFTGLRPCCCSACVGLAPQNMGWAVIYPPGSSWSCGGSCADRCECASNATIDLGLYPLQTVTEVKVDGVALDAADYRIDDWRWLRRLDGDGWPTCQNLALDDTETGTWSVSGTYGLAPSDLVMEGTRALACEIAKACSGLACSLPQRVTSISRQGVSMALVDPQEFLTAAPGQPVRTGVYLADLAIAQENPGGLTHEARAVSPQSYRQTIRKVDT